MDEGQIILDCQQGQLDQFTLIYDKYFKKIYSFIYYRTCYQDYAEDICSQTFMKALENISKYNPEKGPFVAWLYCIARNLIIDHFRSNVGKDADIESFWDIKSNDNVEMSVKNNLKIQEVKRYLDKLKPEQKEIILMRIWDEMSFKEIAAMTNKSEENCKVIFCRGMKVIRNNVDFLLLLIAIKSNF